MTFLNAIDRLTRPEPSHNAGAARRACTGNRGARQLAATTGIALLAVVSVGGAQNARQVKSEGPGQWGSDVRLVHEFTIGELDGRPEYEFGLVRGIAAEDCGAFYVYDLKQEQIRRYDANGRFERLIGRRGGGPGEYQSVAGITVTSDRLLMVHDPRSWRITSFQPDGKIRRELSLRRGFDAGDFSIDMSGRIYLKNRLPGPLEGPSARHQWVRLSREGLVLDSLPIPPDETPVGGTFFLVTPDGNRYSFPPKRTISAPYALGGMVTARADDYRFVVTTAEQPDLVVQRRHSRVPLGAVERDEWVAIANQVPPHIRAPNVRYAIPKLKPVIRDLFSDHLGRVWVDVYVAAEKRNEPPRRPGSKRPPLNWRERTTYDVFAPTGAYLGRVQLPAWSTLLDVRDNRLYMRTSGPDGEDRVSVYRIAGANLSR